MEQDTNRHSLSTFNSRKNRIFLTKLLVAVLLLFGYINHVLPEYDKGYNAALIDKVDRLVSINEPKIVLLGNSNLTFGINSQMMEEELGMPVVNMGLHGGCGNAFHEEMSKYNIIPGDIYVLCHSSFGDNNRINDTMAVWSAIENHFKLWKILRFCDIKAMAESFPVYLKKSLKLYSSGTGNKDPGGVYSRTAFNKYGDIGVFREKGNFVFEERTDRTKISDIAINRVNRLNAYITQRGATLVVAAYPIGNGKYEMDAQRIVDYQKELSRRLDCPVISNYADYLLNYIYFYNTELHLNTKGAEVRTTQLIKDLKNWRETGMEADPEKDEYTDILSDDNLSHISDLSEYLDSLLSAKDRYTIIISAKGDSSSALNDDIFHKLQSLGMTSELQQAYGYAFVMVVERGNTLFEDCGTGRIEARGLFDDCRMQYTVTSGGYTSGNVGSIILNGQEYSRNGRGLNMVVYSNETHRMLDEVCFDTASDKMTAIR